MATSLGFFRRATTRFYTKRAPGMVAGKQSTETAFLSSGICLPIMPSLATQQERAALGGATEWLETTVENLDVQEGDTLTATHERGVQLVTAKAYRVKAAAEVDFRRGVKRTLLTLEEIKAV